MTTPSKPTSETELEREIRRQLNAQEGYDYKPYQNAEDYYYYNYDYDAYRQETPQERQLREIRQAEGLRNAYRYNPINLETPEEREARVYRDHYGVPQRINRLALKVTWAALAALAVLGVYATFR